MFGESHGGTGGVIISCMTVCLKTVGPCIPTRSTCCFHRPGSPCLHQARSAVKCLAREQWDGGEGSEKPWHVVLRLEVLECVQLVALSSVRCCGFDADRYLSIEITRRLQRPWSCFQRYKMEIYDRPGVRLRLKVRLLKAEVVETITYGCMTWSPRKPDYDRLRRVQRSMLLRCLGWRKRKHDDHTLSYADALAQTDSESVEAIVRKTEDFVCVIRGTYGGGASDTEGDVWGVCWG